MNEKEFAELAAGHALHALSAADEQSYAQALIEHPEWTEIAAYDIETTALLGDAVAPINPPVSIRDSLLAQIATTPQGHATTAPADDQTGGGASEQTSAPAPKRWSRAIFALAASVVLVVGLGIGAAFLIPQLMRPASVVALDQIETAPDSRQATVELEAGAQATAHWSESIGTVVLVTEGLEQLDDDRTYEMWFVRGDTPVSAGLFETDAGAATALLDGEMHEGDVIAVTVEPTGGSPTGQPTTDPIIAIPTA